MTKETYKISGMDCASCAIKVENIVKKTEGVSFASVSFPLETIAVDFDKNKISFDDLNKIVSSVGGYKIIKKDEMDGTVDHSHHEKNDLKIKLIVGSVLAVLVFVGSMMKVNPWILFVLSTPVQFWVGWQFYGGLKLVVKYHTSNMDTLVAIGTLSAYFYSVAVTVYPEFFIKSGVSPDLYFETSSVIIVLIILGRYMEFLMRRRASDAIKKLAELQPKTATILRGGKEVEISISEIKIGDIIIVKPGGKVPIDGIVVDGSSEIDESMVTGESMTVLKKQGDKVIGGTINKFGTFSFKADKIGKDTFLSQIIKTVEEAQNSKAPIQRLADIVSSYFVPAVIVVALVTFISWYLLGSFEFGLISFIGVLIISCPCALGLATPIAIMISSGNASKMGILVKNAESLETANKITTIVFDKTGTLTKGSPEVQNIFMDDNVFNLVYSLEKNSEHPLASAINKKAEEKNMQAQKIINFKAIVGRGIIGEINNKKYILGNESFLNENNINISDDEKEKIKNEESLGRTAIMFSDENNYLGFISIADEIRDEAKEAIKTLKDKGYKVVMLSGDNLLTAKAIADELGIDNYFAKLIPSQKVEIIKDLQLKGEKVAFVGDGINDAPALVQSDLGIAMGSGTDIAAEAGSVVLTHSNLNLISKTIFLSKRTLRIIKQNLFWAFGYNIILIPVAAGVFYPLFGVLINPVFAAAAMSLSSISVIGNSLRLKR